MEMLCTKLEFKRSREVLLPCFFFNYMEVIDMDEREINDIMKKWRKKVSLLKDKMEVLYNELDADSPWPYWADEEGTPIEAILSDQDQKWYKKYQKLRYKNELLMALGDWENERECIPWEWVELIIKDVVKSIEKSK